MNKKKISFVFFGSGPVAAASLELLSRTFTIEAIVTKATTQAEMLAVCPQAKVYTVSDKKELDALFTTKKFSSRLGILIDFGIIVSNKIIEYFELGIINSHFSLLPELRGADPISFAILEGKSKTGVSLMLLVEAMDEGPILSIGEYELHGSETTPELTDELIQLSNSLLQSAIPQYANGHIDPAPQKHIEQQFGRKPSYTRKLNKSDGIVNWTKPAVQIEREIRAFTGWPKSQASFTGIDCVLIRGRVVDAAGDAGSLFIFEKQLAVYCGENALLIEELKPAGKNAMSSQAFLAGYRNKINI